jgi:hypothetical protein
MQTDDELTCQARQVAEDLQRSTRPVEIVHHVTSQLETGGLFDSID